MKKFSIALVIILLGLTLYLFLNSSQPAEENNVNVLDENFQGPTEPPSSVGPTSPPPTQ